MMYSRPDFRGNAINEPMRHVVGGSQYRRSYAFERANTHQYKLVLDGQIQRFEVRSGDVGDATNLVSGNERSEVVVDAPLTPGRPESIFAFEEEGWLAYSFMIETPITAEFAIVGQWHDYPEPEDVHMSPPLSFVAYPSKVQNGQTVIPFAMATMFDPNLASPIANPNYRTRWSGSLVMGKWTNIVLNFRASIKDTGFLRLWLDGELVCNAENISFGFNNRTGFAYWQYGIYRKKDANTMIAHYANMRVGRENMAHLIDQPNPLLGRIA